jgi:hypothetical protein
MEFTTQLGLHSQTIRLFEGFIQEEFAAAKNGAFTLYGLSTIKCASFQKTWAAKFQMKSFSKLQVACRKDKRLQIWALPVSFAITRGILVSFFSSAY